MLPKKINTSGPEWLRFAMIRGFEGEGEGAPAGEGDPAEGAEEEGEGSEETQSLDRLQRALKAERIRSKNLEKRLRDASRGESEEEGEESEEEGEDAGKGKPKAPRSKAAREAEAKLQRLNGALVKASFATTVARLATNFVDPQDVVDALDLSLITHEQDDDDPSNVVWDESELRAAIKDLGKRKPHFLKPAAEGGTTKTPQRPSGSKFAGAGKPSTTTNQQAKLTEFQQRFSAMRGVQLPQG